MRATVKGKGCLPGQDAGEGCVLPQRYYPSDMSTSSPDHHAGHSLLLLDEAKRLRCCKNKTLKDFEDDAAWLHMTDTVIEACLA
jgi:hypothetical protein